MSFMENQKNTGPGSHSSANGLYYCSWTSPIGLLHIVATSLGPCRVLLGSQRPKDLRSFLEKSYGVRPLRKPLLPLIRQLYRYFAGDQISFQYPAKINGASPFDRKVWKVVSQIPYGQTRSYSWIARKMGHPRATRAVGGSCGRNPLPLLIPCHRVITQSGKLGGYTGGIQIKIRLLELESRNTNTAHA